MHFSSIFLSNLVLYKRHYLGRVKRIWYLSPMRAAKVRASLRIHAVSPEPPLLAHTRRESRGTFKQKARSLAPLNGWACAVTICHAGMLEDKFTWRGSFNLLVLGIDHYIAIVKPLHCNRLVSNRRTKVIISLIWIVRFIAAVIDIIPAIFTYYEADNTGHTFCSTKSKNSIFSGYTSDFCSHSFLCTNLYCIQKVCQTAIVSHGQPA